MTISRSVINPMSRAPSRMGRNPTSRDFIFSAASNSDRVESIISKSVVIISLTFISRLLF